MQACERILGSRAGTPVRDWLEHRGIDLPTARANRVGADPGRSALSRRRGLPYGANVGVTFPALDQVGGIRYVQTRLLAPSPDDPKYDGPARALGQSPRLSWGVTITAPAPGWLVVCEGIPDMLTAARAGFQAVGLLGSDALNAGVAAQLATRAAAEARVVVAIPDRDDSGAGLAWAERLGGMLKDHGHDLQILEPPEGLDLNDWALQDPNWADWLPPGRAEVDHVDCPDTHVVDWP